MRCLALTRRRERCARTARAARLTCAEHGWQPVKMTAASVAAVGVVAALANDSLGILDRLRDDEPPSTDAECIEAYDSDVHEERIVESWYCDTEFANIWAPDLTLQMLRENRELVLEHYDRIFGAPTSDETFSDVSTSDPRLDGGNLRRIFVYWPDYDNTLSMVVGQVRAAHSLVEDELSSDWVVQLGTVSDDTVLVYVRVVGEPGWEPPPEPECEIGVAELIPIARGYVVRADGLGQYDVIYGVASGFFCMPALEMEEPP